MSKVIQFISGVFLTLIVIGILSFFNGNEGVEDESVETGTSPNETVVTDQRDDFIVDIVTPEIEKTINTQYTFDEGNKPIFEAKRFEVKVREDEGYEGYNVSLDIEVMSHDGKNSIGKDSVKLFVSLDNGVQSKVLSYYKGSWK